MRDESWSQGEPALLIPLIKEFLVKIDYKTQRVFMHLPPGLLEVNRAL